MHMRADGVCIVLLWFIPSLPLLFSLLFQSVSRFPGFSADTQTIPGCFSSPPTPPLCQDIYTSRFFLLLFLKTAVGEFLCAVSEILPLLVQTHSESLPAG